MKLLMDPILKKVNHHVSIGDNETALRLLLDRCIEFKHQFYQLMLDKLTAEINLANAQNINQDHHLELNTDLKFKPSTPMGGPE